MTPAAIDQSVLANEMVKTASSKIIVRTLLSVSEGGHDHFTSDLFAVEGPAQDDPDFLVGISVQHGTSQTPVKLFNLRRVPGNKARETLGGWIANQRLRVSQNDAVWFQSWLSPEPFVGMLLLSDSVQKGNKLYTRIPPHHISLQLYHGAISASLSLLAANRAAQTMNREEEEVARAVTRLAERFGAFMWVQHRKVHESLWSTQTT